MVSSEPTSLLHLPPEIRNLVYDLAFNTNVKINILDPVHSGQTRDITRVWWRLLPGTPDSRAQWLPDLMKEKCERLIVKAAQSDEVEDDHHHKSWDSFWDTEGFPSYPIPLLLQIKEEIQTLKIIFIFWF
ncbi:hypothetical protein NCS56_01461300 [Fusarium sp. Ph1]|nr:hypothetical protein NCS56_01461300 [Fusarium sp. Ph1]